MLSINHCTAGSPLAGNIWCSHSWYWAVYIIYFNVRMDSVDWIDSACAAVRDNSGLGSISALPTPSSPSAAKLKCRKQLIHAGVVDCDIYPVAVSVAASDPITVREAETRKSSGKVKRSNEPPTVRTQARTCTRLSAEASKRAVCRKICGDSV